MKILFLFLCVVFLQATALATVDEGRVLKWEDCQRQEVLEWFKSNWFGRTPVGRPPDETIGERSLTCAGGKVKINFHLSLPEGADREHPAPVFVFGDHFNRETSATHTSVYPGIPTNTVTRRGYAYVCVNFNDVCLNTYDIPEYNGSFTTGVHRVYGGLGRGDSWGTIGAWAWCFSRTMDWIETRPELDAKRVAIVGHSRGGKTALWAGAQDTRFAMVVSNNSGAGGARLWRMDDGERHEMIADFLSACVGHWFCPDFFRWAGREREISHDADDLIRLVAPRCVYVASSSQDKDAYPEAEQAAVAAAKELWQSYGVPSRVGCHVKEGRHSMTAEDWVHFLDFADRELRKPGK